MKKTGRKLLTFVMALALLVTTIFGGTSFNVKAEGTPTFGYVWANCDDEGTWSEDPEGYIHSDMYGATIGSSSFVYFYYENENGERSMLTAADLSSSDGTMVSIQDSSRAAGMIELSYHAVGTATIDYNHNGTVYKMNVSIKLPPVGLYSQPKADAAYYAREFTITDSNDKFYLVTTGDYVLTDVMLGNGLEDIAEYNIDSTGKFATITVTGTPSTGRWYDVRFSAESATYQDVMTDHNWGVQLINGKPDLQFYWGQWNDGTLTENRNDGIRDTWYTRPGNDGFLFFYFVDNGVETFVSPEDLTSSNEKVVTISPHPNNADAALLEIVGFGTSDIQYTVDGTTYSAEVVSELPTIGFYSSTTASESTYLYEFELTNTADTIYVVGKDGWKITSATLNETFADIATIEVDKVNGYATVKITGTPESGRWYNVSCVAENPDTNGFIGDYNVGLRITDSRPGLKFHWGMWNNGNLTENTQDGLRSLWNTQAGNSSDMFIYYVDGETQIPLTAKDVTSSDTSIVEVVESYGSPNAIRLEVVGFGEATIDYTLNGETYSMTVVSKLPEIGFYSSPTASEETFIYEASVTDDNKTFYIVGSNGWKITSATLNADFDEVADLTVDADNGYAAVTITEMPPYGDHRWYGVRCAAVNEITGDIIRDYGTGVDVVNGNPFYMGYADQQWMIKTGERIGPDVYFRYNESDEEICAEVTDVKVTGGDLDAVQVEKIVTEDETFWVLEAKKAGVSEVTITHKDPEDTTKTIDYTYEITVVDKMMWINHYMSTNVENFGVPGDVSERNLVMSVEYYDEAADEIKTIDVTDQATYDWAVTWSDISDNTTVKFNKNVATVTLGNDEQLGNGVRYECHISYEFEGETLTAHMSDFVDVVDEYYYVTGTELPSDFDYGDTATVAPIVKKVSYDYDAGKRSETTATEDLILVWASFSDGLVLQRNGVAMENWEEIPYDPADVYMVKRGAHVWKETRAFQVEVVLDGPYGWQNLGRYSWDVEACDCPHPEEYLFVVDEMAPTCDEPGWTGDVRCGVCDEIVKESTDIAPLGHSYKSTLIPATCTESGEKTYECECGSSYTETILPDGHIFQAGACIICNEEDPNYKPDTQVVVVPDQATEESANKAANDISTTVADTIQAVKEDAENENVSTDKLVEIVKDALANSKDKEVAAVANAVSDETLGKIIVAIEEDKEITTVVSVQPVEEEDFDESTQADAAKIETLVSKSGEVAQYLDINVLVQAKDAEGNVETLGTIDEPTEKITFTVSIPENLQKADRIFYVVLVHDGGAAKKIPAVNNGDGTVSFETDKFSTYALAYTDTPLVNPFTDVEEDDYFYAPVLWAYEVGITAGVEADIFAPKASCTRAQVVSFLWRAEGCPESVGSTNPFTDLKAGEYYVNAVQWAYENQIAAGTSTTEFSPKATVTRAQFVSFLWRLEGCPEPEGTENSFTDVKSSEYYAKAVQWAVENGIAYGVTSTEFSPKAPCTRAQVVSFLHRYYEE